MKFDFKVVPRSIEGKKEFIITLSNQNLETLLSFKSSSGKTHKILYDFCAMGMLKGCTTSVCKFNSISWYKHHNNHKFTKQIEIFNIHSLA